MDIFILMVNYIISRNEKLTLKLLLNLLYIMHAWCSAFVERSQPDRSPEGQYFNYYNNV